MRRSLDLRQASVSDSGLPAGGDDVRDEEECRIRIVEAGVR